MQNITEPGKWRIWLTGLMVLLFGWNLSAQQVTVEIGTGTATMSHPFYSLYEDSRTQILFTAAEITAGGGAAGEITSLAFNVQSFNAYALDGMNVDMQHTTATTLSAFANSGWSNCFSGTYSVPANGWQTITFTTPFTWDGTSNLLVNICFDNDDWGGSSYVYGTAAAGMTWHQHADGAAGCSLTGGSLQANRPNIQLTIETGPPPPPPSVTVQVGTGTATASYPYYTLWMDSRTQFLYTATEIFAAGGLPGDILSIGFNVSSANAHLMNGFNIDMQNYSGATIPAFVSTGWTNVYTGTYSVPGTGEQTIELQTPFTWDGISNLLVGVCFDNNDWGSNSSVLGTVMPGLVAHNHADLSTGNGCTDITTVGASYTTRANIYLTISPAAILPTGTVQGFVTNGFGVPVANATVAADGLNGSYVTTSGPNGAYVIDDISIGTYTMAAVKDGYNMVTVEGVVIMPAATTYQNFELPRPSMAVTPNPYNVTVNPNEMLEGAFNIANNGDGTLEWTAEVVYPDDASSIAPGIDPTIPVRDFTTATQVESFGEDATIGGGNGQALNSRNTMLCPAGSLFNNAPVGSDNGYNAAGAYTCYQQFSGVSGSFNKLTFWAIFTEAPPATMNFDIEICGPGASQPGPVVSSLTASLTPVNTGTPVIGYDTYMFTADLPSTTLPAGWIGIHCSTAAPTFYWLNSYTGTGAGVQFSAGSYVPLTEYLAMCLAGGGSGGIGDGWLTLGSYDGTVGPSGNYSNPAFFNAQGAEAGQVYTAEVVFTSEPNVGTVTVPVTMVIAGPALDMPEDLVAVLSNPVTGQVSLSWNFNPTDAFLNFAIRRNNVVVGYTANNNYVDMLPTFGIYDYTVQAVYDEGMSAPAGPVQVEWANPTAVVTPLYIYDEVWVNNQVVETVTISNTGEGTLTFSFPEWVEDDGNRAPLAYCAASGGCSEHIGTFIFGDQINNSSACSGYADYTSISAEVERGESYAVTIQNPDPWSSDIAAVWVDWNQNESFEDAGERYNLTIGGGGATFTGTVTVPESALDGPTRLRARLQYSGTLSPCGTQSFGEVEDYTLVVENAGFITSVVPAEGYVQPGQSRTVAVTWDATGWDPGMSYFQDLVVNTNDLANQSVTIVNEMYVFTPAQFAGTVTNADSGEPLNGVLVTANPTGYFATLTFDDGTAENGWGINAGFNASLGNLFPVSSNGTIQSVDIFFDPAYGGNMTETINVDLYDAAHNLLGTSAPFLVTAGGWYNVVLPNIEFDGPFFAMVHYNLTASPLRYIGSDENGPYTATPGLAYIMEAGVFESFPEASLTSSVLMIRANVFVGDDLVVLDASQMPVIPESKHETPAFLSASNHAVNSGRTAGVMNTNNSRDLQTFTAMTDEDGEYTMYVNPGRYNVSFEKYGFQTYVEMDTIALQGLVTPLDAQLWEEAYPPSFVYAEVNEEDTQCVVTWGDGSGPYEIVYDDGSAENYAAWALPGNLNAVKFTPADYPAVVIGGKVYVGDGSFPNNNTGFIGTTFGMLVLDNDGANGLPGTVLDSISVTVNNYGWVTFTGFDVEIADGDFYLAMMQSGISPNVAPIGIDENIPTLYRSYSRNVVNGGNWGLSPFQDMMIRAIVYGSPSPTDGITTAANPVQLVPQKQRALISQKAPLATSGFEGAATYRAALDIEDGSRAETSYRIVRYSQFDPNGNPEDGTVTGLSNAVTSNTYTDGGTTWANLPAGWYAYGVAANYPNGDVSDTTVSNIVGHKILAEITVNVSLTTGGSPEGAVVSLIGQAYPYETYTLTIPADGQVIFPAVWYGPYVVEAMKVGFDDYVINVNITGDRTINIILLEKKYKPRNLYVDPLTLVATWDEPLAVSVLEDFEGAVFPPAGWQALTQNTTGWFGSSSGGSTNFAIPSHTKYAVVNDDIDNGNGCCDYLITPEMDWTNLDSYRLNFASFYSGTYSQSAYIEISTDAGATWTVINTLQAAPSGWVDLEIDLTQYSGASGLSSVWLAFHADDNGEWSSGWAVDDVQIASGGVPFDGYGVFLDGTLVDNTPEETYTYRDLNYGQEYLAGVAALFSSGYSELDTYLFRSQYLYPPDSLQGMSPQGTDYAHLWWLPPSSPTGLGDNTDALPVTIAQPALDIAVDVLPNHTFPQRSIPLSSSRVILYDNGTIINSPGTGNGGADESILQTGLGMNTLGAGFQQSAGNSVADDFEVTAPWTIQSFEFFGYQTGSSTTSTFTGAYLRIWDGDPTAGGAIIWGDLTTNLMASTEWSNVYRNSDGPGGATDRPVMRVVAETPGLALTPGTYWVEFTTAGTLGSGPWVPAVTIQGQTSTGNAKQNQSGTWVDLIDVGPQGMPFIINGAGGGAVGIPTNLLGYNLYRNDAVAAYIESPTTEYFDMNLDPGTYMYDVTAVYDLEPYGYPGQTAESMKEGTVEIDVIYGYELPFMEDWNTGLFTTNQWTTQGANWRIAGQVGNPAPAAEFFYNPAQTDYALSLTSSWINGREGDDNLIDGDIWLDFDLKLEDLNQTGDETLQVEVFNGSAWSTVVTYTAEGNTDWEMEHVKITSQAKNKVFRVRFTAKGTSSLDIYNWMIDNIHIYRQCAPPTELTATEESSPGNLSVILNWTAPGGTGPGPSGWLAWDNGINDNAIGLTGGGTFSVAARFTPTQLTQYAGTSLTKVRFFPYAPGTTIVLKVWTGANASQLVLTQPLASYTSSVWNEIDLNTAVPVTGATELWFGYTVTHGDGVFAAGCDEGPAVAGFGDKISLDGSTWDDLSAISDISANWNLQGFVETLDGVSIPLQPISDNTVYAPVSASALTSLSYSALPGASLPLEVSGSRELVGYNVYRDGDMIGSTEDITYTDADQSVLEIDGTYCYTVTAVYEDCESPMSEEACITLVDVPVIGISALSIYPNPANSLVNIELTNDISHMVVYNYLGKVVAEQTITKDRVIKLDVRNYESGAYLIKFTTNSGENLTRKIVVTH